MNLRVTNLSAGSISAGEGGSPFMKGARRGAM